MEHRSRFSRLTGVIYVVGALFGLIISVGGLVVLWTTRDDVTGGILNTVALAGRTLEATQETVLVVSDSLDQAGTELLTIQRILEDVAGTLEDSGGLLTATSSLVGSDMPGFVEEAQSSLTTMQASARLVDDTLRFVSSIPLIGGRYRPEVTLQESVGEVSRSLDPLPETFRKIQRELDVSAANVDIIQSEVDQLAVEIDGIETSLSSAQSVAERYRLILVDFQGKYDRLEQRLPVLFTTIYLGLTLILIWIFITQLGLLLHGIQLMR